MDLPLIGHLPGVVAARSPEPHRLFFSNPDWALDEQGPLLLWDTFGGDFAIHLARPDGEGWKVVEEFAGAMHSHLIHLPDQGLTLVLGVRQTGHPRSIDLWWSDGADVWQGPIELFGGADYHAGSTPWAIHGGRLFVPFEIQQTNAWGSYCFGAVHAALDSDLRRPGSWTLTQGRVPWTVFPTATATGGLEGNLVVAPDGELYNLLRLSGYNRLGRARWNGAGWDWLGLVQGVHNQSKHELFSVGDRWYLLANGWPARMTPHIPNPFRNTLCLWEATEPDLSRWRLLRVIASDHDPRHAFSYVAGIVDPRDDTLLIAERNGDDETHNFHDTNNTVVRRKPGLAAWVEQPALVPFGHDDVGEGGEWVKANAQDGLLLSHLDGATYPLTLTATVRIDELSDEVGVLDLLGFATCDLVLIAGLQLVRVGDAPTLSLSTGGRRVSLRETLEVGQSLRLRLRLRSPMRAEAQVDDDTPVVGRTHVASDPSLAGILPRADRPTARLGKVTVTVRPALTAGTTACEAPALPSPWIVTDGRGMTGGMYPAENLAPNGPLIDGGHNAYFEPWAGGLMPGKEAAAVWSPVDAVPPEFALGGYARILDTDATWAVVLAGLGQRTPERGLRRDRPYLALLIMAEGGTARLGLAWHGSGDRPVAMAKEPLTPWFFYALSATTTPEGLAVTVYGGEPGEAATEVLTHTIPLDTVADAKHWLALIGKDGGEVRGFGGVFATRAALTAEQANDLCRAGFVTKMDAWPSRRPTCAEPEADVAADPAVDATGTGEAAL